MFSECSINNCIAINQTKILKENQSQTNETLGVEERNKKRKSAYSGIEGVNGDGTSADEDLIGLEIGDFHIGPQLQYLRPTEPRQHHRPAARNHASHPDSLWIPRKYSEALRPP
jgi:hypothetical protein